MEQDLSILTKIIWIQQCWRENEIESRYQKITKFFI